MHRHYQSGTRSGIGVRETVRESVNCEDNLWTYHPPATLPTCPYHPEKDALFEVGSVSYCSACLDQYLYLAVRYISQHQIGYEGHTDWTVGERDCGVCEKGEFSVALHAHEGMAQHIYYLVADGDRDPM